MNDLEKLIMAKCPLIQIVTHEEKRATEYIREVTRRMSVSKNIRILTWSIARGLVDGSEQTTTPMDSNELMRKIVEHEGHAVFILYDFHPEMTDPVTIRLLRESAFALKVSPDIKAIVLVQPVKVIPTEIEKTMTVIEFPLPTLADLNDRLSMVLKKLGVKDIDDPELINKIASAGQGLTRDEFDTTLAMCKVDYGTIDSRAIQEVSRQKQAIVKKSGVLECVEINISVNDIGGLDNMKEWLKKRSRALSPKAKEFGLPNPKGILLVGAPGAGKSLSAKAVASIFGVPLFRLDIGSMFGKLVGQSEDNMRSAIKIAEAAQPCILWTEEFEKALSGVGANGGDSGTANRVFGTLLTWMSEKTSQVFIVATANNISMMPPELMRKGRFDEIFFVDLPSSRERSLIFGIHIAKRGRDVGTFDTDRLAQTSDGFSGAEIEETVQSALFDAFYEGRELQQSDILSAIKCTVPLSVTMREDINGLREWAKSGRAVMASSPESRNPLKNTSVIKSADKKTGDDDEDADIFTSMGGRYDA